MRAADRSALLSVCTRTGLRSYPKRGSKYDRVASDSGFPDERSTVRTRGGATKLPALIGMVCNGGRSSCSVLLSADGWPAGNRVTLATPAGSAMLIARSAAWSAARSSGSAAGAIESFACTPLEVCAAGSGYNDRRRSPRYRNDAGMQLKFHVGLGSSETAGLASTCCGSFSLAGKFELGLAQWGAIAR